MAFSTGTMGRLSDGDEAEWNRLVERMTPGLIRFFVRFGFDDGRADELAQDVFVRLLEIRLRCEEKGDPFDLRRERFVGWLCGVARKIALEQLRRSRPDHVSLAECKPAPGGDVLSELEASLHQLHVVSCYLQALMILEDHPSLEPWALEAWMRRKGDVPGPGPQDGCEAASLDAILMLLKAKGIDVSKAEVGRALDRVRVLLRPLMSELLARPFDGEWSGARGA